MIGHGRRLKLALDAHHTRIRVRRALCRCCHLTMTVLPSWSLPGTHYTLYARQESVQRCQEGARVEDAAPVTLDPDRIADPSTVRRWLKRRLLGLGWCAMAGAKLVWMVTEILAPTILAWDLGALAGTLILEAKAP